MSFITKKRSFLILSLASVLSLAGGATALADPGHRAAPLPRPVVSVRVPGPPAPGRARHAAEVPYRPAPVVVHDHASGRGGGRYDDRNTGRYARDGRVGQRYAPLAVTPVRYPPVYVPAPTVYTGYTTPAQPMRLDVASAIGRPPDADRAGASGTFIWLGSDGVFHLRTASAGRAASFSGSIGSPDGQLDLVGSTSQAEQVGNGVSFGYATTGEQNRVDFRLESGVCVSFDLSQSGAAGVFLGGNESSVPSSFVLCS